MIGAPLRRKEDPKLVSGLGRYTGDIVLPNMLHAKFVRSHHAHARIASISLEAARAMPHVVAVFKASDAPELNHPLPTIFPSEGLNVRMPFPLARDEVRYLGEPVAVVLAEDLYSAADAAEAVEIEYEPLPVVVDPQAATTDTGAKVHDDLPNNLAGSRTIAYGSVEDAFDRAEVVVSRRLRVARSTGAAIEPRTITVDPGTGDGITVFDSTQAPHSIRSGLAQALGMERESVRVIAPDVGGGFGPKGRLYSEEVVLAVAARRVGRPVAWRASRSEDFLSTYQGRGIVAECEIAATRDGKLLALKVRMLQDCGAYLATAFIVPQNSAQHMLGPYRLPALSIVLDGVYTHTVPLTPLRGGGREIGVFVIERMMDALAAEVGVDPIIMRKRNVLAPADFPYDTGYPARAGGSVVYDSGDYPSALDRASELIGYRDQEKQSPVVTNGRLHGVGITLFLESTGMGSESSRAELLPDGRVQVVVGSPSNGQSHATTMAQICAQHLGVDVAHVDYISGDTGLMDQGIGTFGSRIAIMAGNATREAALQLRRRLLDAASDSLEVAAEDLEIVDGFIGVKGVPGRGLTFSDLALRHSNQRFVGESHYQPERGAAFAGGAHAAEVAVDPETGQIEVVRYIVVHDCGTVINPVVVEGQVHGGVAHGAADALMEEIVYDDSGSMLTGSFQSYGMPEVNFLPPSFEVEHQESPSPFNPEGIKGAGEGGTIGSLATIAQAVDSALKGSNVMVSELPIRPAWVVELTAGTSRRREG